MGTSNTGDELLKNNRLSESRSTEQTGLTTSNERGEQVDNLDTGFEDFGVGREFRQGWCFAVNWPSRVGFDLTALIDGFAEHVEDPTEGAFADRNRYRSPGIDAIKAPHQTVGATQSHAANFTAAKVLLDFTRKVDFNPFFAADDFHRVINRWQAIGWEFGVEGRANDLTDFTNTFGGRDAHDLLCAMCLKKGMC